MSNDNKRKPALEHDEGPAQPRDVDRPEKGLARDAAEHEVEMRKAKKDANEDKGSIPTSVVRSSPD